MTLDFCTPCVPPEKLHRNFVTLSSGYDDGVALKRFTGWAEGLPDKDGDLVKKFQTSFNSVFWEVYLHRLFISLGYSHDYSHQSPDFYISNGKSQFCVEAAIASNSHDAVQEHEHGFNISSLPDNFTELNIQSMLRYLNTIHKKSQCYTNSYSKKKHVCGKPFVIALAPFDRPFFWLELDRAILSVLYDYYIDESNTIDAPVVNPGFVPVKSLGFVRNKNGKNIDLGIFLNDKMKHVSAVIFSCTATVGKLRAFSLSNSYDVIFRYARYDKQGKPQRYISINNDYKELIQDGLYVFHNPFAEYPLPPSAFRFKGIQQSFALPQDGIIEVEGIDDFLVNRVSKVCK